MTSSVSGTRNINGMIWKNKIDSVRQSLLKSLDLGESSMSFSCACFGIFFDIELYFPVEFDLPVVYLLQMSTWYFGGFNLTTFLWNPSSQQISQI